MTRCGTVAIVGPPNAGKSSLLNRLVGADLAGVSARPQSTRQAIAGIRTSSGTQAIFVDTPGLLQPKYALQSALLEIVVDALTHADVVIQLMDGAAGHHAIPEGAGPLLAKYQDRILHVVSKGDLVSTPPNPRVPSGALVISARTGAGLDALWAAIEARLPEASFRHAADDLSTQPMRFFVSEAVRDAAFQQLEQELPYAVHCDVEEYREGADPVYIRATLYVERESQKRIVIGQGGRQLRRLGMSARERVQGLTGTQVYLDLWVKVARDWRRDPSALQRFGFPSPPGQR